MKDQIKDFKSLDKIYCKQLQETVSLKSPEWNKVKCLMADKESPHVLFIKYINYETSFVSFVSASGHEASAFPVALENKSTVSKAKKMTCCTCATS